MFERKIPNAEKWMKDTEHAADKEYPMKELERQERENYANKNSIAFLSSLHNEHILTREIVRCYAEIERQREQLKIAIEALEAVFKTGDYPAGNIAEDALKQIGVGDV